MLHFLYQSTALNEVAFWCAATVSLESCVLVQLFVANCLLSVDLVTSANNKVDICGEWGLYQVMILILFFINTPRLP